MHIVDPVNLSFEFNSFVSIGPVKPILQNLGTKSVGFENSKTKAVPRTLRVLFLKVKYKWKTIENEKKKNMWNTTENNKF